LAIGAVILIPSLTLLFGMVVHGRFDERPESRGSLQRVGHPPEPADPPPPTEPGRATGVVAAILAALGLPLTLVFDGGLPLALGVVTLLAAVAAAAAYVVPRVALADEDEGGGNARSETSSSSR
jgi:hypothetical protein